MALLKTVYQVDDLCLGPDKKNGYWEMFIFIQIIRYFTRKTKRGKQDYMRKSRTVKSFSGKTKTSVIGQLYDFCSRDDVEVIGMEAPAVLKGKKQ